MPETGVTWQAHENIMRFEEIVQVVKSAVKVGVTKIRLTGGEPLVRPGIVELVRLLNLIPEISDISMTTNGHLLAHQADALKKAGLKRVNISLDTFKPDLFKKITRNGDLSQVLAGIEAAEKAGLSPIKINMVVVRGINDSEILEFAKLTFQHPWHVRYIELMPIKNQSGWGNGFPNYEEGYISTHEMLKILDELNLNKIQQFSNHGPATLYKAQNAKGLIGFISPIDDDHFCASCNRLRLTADGHLRSCLMSEQEVDLLPAIRNGINIDDMVQAAIHNKPAHHFLKEKLSPNDRSMMQIGG
jgi:cyclic pyranopterin phosphate synthase